jgi:hypothetical protein
MALTNFIPELWAARLLENLENAHVATLFVNRDYEGDIKKMGDTVHINSLGKISVKDYTVNGKIEDPEVLSTEDQTLVIDQAKYFNFYVDDVEKVQAAGPVMDKAMQSAAYEIADVVDKAIFAAMAKDAKTKLNKTVNKGNIYDALIELRTAMNKLNVPKTGRRLACSSDVTGLILRDERLIKATETGQERATNGFIGRLAGFDIYETENVPANTIVAGSTIGTSFAEQITEVKAYEPENRFAEAVKGLNVYGIKVVEPKAVATIKYTIKEDATPAA